MAKNTVGIICQSCGVEAPAWYVDFHQNIGMLVARRHYTVKGNLCKRCVHKHFWKMTATTLFLGPWGYISLVVSPFFILNNIGWYVTRLGMPGVPAGATKPVLTPEALAKLEPHAPQLVSQLNANIPLNTIAPDIAAKAGVTPGQVVLYVVALARQNRPQPAMPAVPIQRGFPVIPVADQPAAMPPPPIFAPNPPPPTPPPLPVAPAPAPVAPAPAPVAPPPAPSPIPDDIGIN